MDKNIGQQTSNAACPPAETFWRVEGSPLNLSAVRPVAFFTWNAQRFTERWARRGGLALLALIRPLLYATNRVFATRVLHALLRGVSQDRLDLLGEEYFHYVLKPRLNQLSARKLKELIAAGESVVLVSQGLDHVMRPLANYLGVERLVANRLEFRDGLATGRLLDPVIRPRGGFARLIPQKIDGRVPPDRLAKDLGFSDRPEALTAAVTPARRSVPLIVQPIALFENRERVEQLSVRQSLAGKHILLIGATGFIGKVWLAKILRDVPNIGKIYLLIRRQRSVTAQRRFEKIVEESPVFEAFHEGYGNDLAKFIGDRVEVVEGDISQPGLGIEPETKQRLAATLDLVVNSSGLTDFNPDLRDALTINIDGTLHLLNFIRECDHAGLLHLSTCYVVGQRDGRVPEELHPNYTPKNIEGFDAEQERLALHALIPEIEARSETAEVTEELRQQALAKAAEAKDSTAAGLETRIRRYRARWIRNQLVEAGMKRAKGLGWPNTYTFTKSLAESLIAKFGADLPIAVVRPSIVETSTQDPFQGWNEGVNTSAPISYLLGTYFRQLPSNKRKCLDLIPVDLVCRGMTLIAAATVQRCHDQVYQLATSAINPCDMRRSVELTALAHRKYYRTQNGLEHRLRARFESIPVSKARYQKLSAPGQKAVVRAIQRISPPPLRKRPLLVNIERNLDRVEKLIELYEPFILLNEQVFEAGNVALLSAALVPEEREAFDYDARTIDWWDYWINIHIPALRKWSYPIIEGRPIETRPRHSFRLSLRSSTGTAMRGAT
ncbi:MAG: SDR family oxidoreductase [Acidobacteria bacterium]|nr:SDR family oxidoreductase [Acidobacteriota bacterium]